MLIDVCIFAVALAMVVQGSTLASTYAGKLAESYRLSKYTVGFIIVAVISILPETFIALNAAAEGVPSFGLGTLFGSNIADLTLVFAILVLYAKRAVRVEGKILKNHVIYPLVLLFPIVLGLDGAYSRLDGIALMLMGGVFYYLALAKEVGSARLSNIGSRVKDTALLLAGMALLLIGAHLTVEAATAFAAKLHISPVLIGMLVVGLGTTMPELFFSLRSIKRREDALAIGDLLGTVLADATIVVGLLALVSPFAFPIKIVYITGLFMVAASVLLFYCMQTRRALTRREGLLLLLFWIVFVVVEVAASAL